MLADQKRLIGDLKDQYADAVDWNIRYKAAFKGIHGSELGALINAMQKPLELGTYRAVDMVPVVSYGYHMIPVMSYD